jgi:hypothetical protein
MIPRCTQRPKQFEEALPVYEARHVIRVTTTYTHRQIDTVYRESATLAAMGDIVKANAREEYAYETLARATIGTTALVPGIMHLAEWYEKR